MGVVLSMSKGWIAASVVLIVTMSILVVCGVIFYNVLFNPASGLSVILGNAADSTMDTENRAWYSTFLDNQEWFYGLVFVSCAG